MQRCAFITLAGAPNAGKSTLINRLVGDKVSIVTPKVQTTRARIRGITTVGDAQLVFVDTPGIFKPKRSLEKAMVRAAWGGMKGADFNCLIVDAKHGFNEEVQHIAEGMRGREGSPILILNKIDLVSDKSTLLLLAAALNAALPFARTFMVSALDGEGVIDIKNYLAGAAQVSPWFYPEGQVTDVSERLFAAEITREKLMMSLRQEVPYQLMVATEAWEEKGQSVTIRQAIYVTTEGQKKIVIGKGGEGLRKVGEQARKELTRLLGRKVHLFLFVKVDPRWLESAEHLRMQGLE